LITYDIMNIHKR